MGELRHIRLRNLPKSTYLVDGWAELEPTPADFKATISKWEINWNLTLNGMCPAFNVLWPLLTHTPVPLLPFSRAVILPLVVLAR